VAVVGGERAFAHRVGARTPALAGGLSYIKDSVFVQCTEDQAVPLIALLRSNSGVVVTGADATNAIRRLSRLAGSLPLMADRRRYSGRRRAYADEAMTSEWVHEQWRAGSPVALTDSGYLPRGDREGLLRLLEKSAKTRSSTYAEHDLMAVLPLADGWLWRDLQDLVKAINAHDVPVGLVLEHRGDPFGALRNVRGLVQLLQASTVPVAVLRSDLSAVGAMAFGAISGAVGTKSGLRHLYPLLPGGRGGFSAGGPAALFDAGKAFLTVEKLALGVAATPDNPMWICECSVCHSRTLDALLGAAELDVMAHNVELVQDLRDRLMTVRPGQPRENAWREICRHADFQYAEAAVETVGWQVPSFLRNWQQV
jgi:hypothetical protein